MKLMIQNNRLTEFILIIAYLFICFSSLRSEADARQYCEQRQDYVDPAREESCGIYENGVSTVSTVENPTKSEIRSAQQEAVSKSQDKIYKKLLSLAQQWSKLDLTPGEKEAALAKFRQQINVVSEHRRCEKRGGKNKHFCLARSHLFLSDNSEKVEKIMNRFIELKSFEAGMSTAALRPARYLPEAYNKKLTIFSDAFPLRKTIRTGESLYSVYTTNLYLKRDDDDIGARFYVMNPDGPGRSVGQAGGRPEGNEIVVMMQYPIRYMDIGDQFHMKYRDTFTHDEAQLTEISEDAFGLYNSTDEPLPEDLMKRQWVPFQKIKYQFPGEFVRWLMDSGYYKESILLVDIKDDDFFEEYYVPKRIRLVDTCDRTGSLTENVQIASNDFYIPHPMPADADGYYSVLLPKHKWNGSGKVSVRVPDYHEKTLSLDPFYKEGPFNTRNDIALVPNRRTITFEITRTEDVMERAFRLTYVVDSTKSMKLNPYFKDSDLFTETLSVPAGTNVSSFALKNDWRYSVNLVDHVRDPDHICDELIRLQIERTAN